MNIQIDKIDPEALPMTCDRCDEDKAVYRVAIDNELQFLCVFHVKDTVDDSLLNLEE